MSPKILIIGSTGMLGQKLLNFSSKHNIKINTITAYRNNQKLLKIKSKYKVLNSFLLSDENQRSNFIKFLKFNKFNIVYFLDFGSASLSYIDVYLKFHSKTYIAVANKELLIAGGHYLISMFNKTNNYLIPLDSEHFSLSNSKLNETDIHKIFITASGGPFYFKKKISLNNVTKKNVLSHPKWIMGKNNLIDSSNFINKILELFELSFIYSIDISKIDFVISPEAFIHSFVVYKNGSICFNCFQNDMIITLSAPLRKFYNLPPFVSKQYKFDQKLFYFEEFNDNRFEILKKIKIVKKFTHYQLLQFMLLNNLAQELYLQNKLKYVDIPSYIFKRIDFKNDKFKINSIQKILQKIKLIKHEIQI